MNSIGTNTALSTAVHYGDVPDTNVRRGYQETEITFISKDCAVCSNNDMVIDEEMHMAVRLAAYLSNLHKVDLLVEKFA